MEEQRNIAVYWDFENVHGALYRRRHGDNWYGGNRYRSQEILVDVDKIMGQIAQSGNIMINKAYANWQSFGRYGRKLLENSVESVQHFPPKARKNGADIRLAMDLFEDLSANPHINTFVLITGDSDFISVIEKARQRGKEVWGIGVSDTVDGVLEGMFDQFFDYNDMVKGAVSPEARRGWDTLERSLAAVASQFLVERSRDSQSEIKAWRARIAEVSPDFDEKHVGAKSFLEALKGYLERRDLGPETQESVESEPGEQERESRTETRSERAPRAESKRPSRREKEDEPKTSSGRRGRSRPEASEESEEGGPADESRAMSRSREPKKSKEEGRDGSERVSDWRDFRGPSIAGAIDILFASLSEAQEPLSRASVKELLAEGIGAQNHQYSVESLMVVFDRLTANRDVFEKNGGFWRLRSAMKGGPEITEECARDLALELKGNGKTVDDATFRELAARIYGQRYDVEDGSRLRRYYNGDPVEKRERSAELDGDAPDSGGEEERPRRRDTGAANGERSKSTDTRSRSRDRDSDREEAPERPRRRSRDAESDREEADSERGSRRSSRSVSPVAQAVGDAIGRRLRDGVAYGEIACGFFRAFEEHEAFTNFPDCWRAVSAEVQEVTGRRASQNDVGAINALLKEIGVVGVESIDNGRRESVWDEDVATEAELIKRVARFAVDALREETDGEDTDWEGLGGLLYDDPDRGEELRRLVEGNRRGTRSRRR